MKTKITKLLALVLALGIAAMALCIPSLAAGTGTITIQATTGKGTRTYAAYRLFDTTSEAEPIVYKFNRLAEDFFNEYTDENGKQYKTEAEAVAYVHGLTDSNINSFGVALYNFITKDAETKAKYDEFKTTATMLAGQSTTMSNLNWGYYLIYDITSETDVRAAVAITSATPNATVKVKIEKPDLTKKIVKDGKELDQASYTIGDVVEFKIVGKVPDMSGFTEYSYKIIDTMGAGFTYVDRSLEVEIGGHRLLRNTMDGAVAKQDGDYTPLKTKAEASGTSTITVDITSILAGYAESLGSSNRTKYTTGDEIVVTYKAVLNQFATIENINATNAVNSAYLESTEGNTTPDTVRVFTYELDITKQNSLKADATELEGATFYVVEGAVTDKAAADISYTEFGKFERDGKTYYMPTGRTVPVAEAADYNAGTGDYAAEGTTEKAGTGNGTEGTWTAPGTNYNGITYTRTILLETPNGDAVKSKMNLAGLGEGTYTLLEQTAPAGYTIGDDPIVFEVKQTFENDIIKFVELVPNEKSAGWIGMNEYDDVKNTLKIQVVNTENGQTLPETGGMGTLLFTVIGLALMAVAVTGFAFKKRAR